MTEDERGMGSSGASEPAEVEVVVVGAGLSGLVAARALHQAGIDVVVVEAAERVGGRTLREESALGSQLDLGGQWIGHDHERVRDLARELGFEVFPMRTGSLPAIADGRRRIRPISAAVLGAGAAVAVAGVLARLGRPRRSRRTVADALARVPGRTARRLAEVVALISWTTDLDRLDLTTMAGLISSQGGVTHMLSTKGGAQEALIVQGAGALAEAIAAELGERVQTGRPVTAVRRLDSEAVVDTAAGEIRAERVIVSLPPPVASRIAHEPPLPASRLELEGGTSMGSVYKAIAVYPEPFWRPASSGELLLLDRPGVAVYDTSAPGGPGHLCLLVGGPEARGLDDVEPAVRRQRLLERLAAHVGPEALNPASWHEKAWHLDEHAGGGYVALPNAGTGLRPWPMSSAPVGRVHWAGSESALDHPGYLDGAIEAGRRAAAEVLAALP